MNIRVLFFASLREAVGVEGMVIELQQGTLAELRGQLATKLGDTSALWARNVRIARNQELLGDLSDETAFADGDELAFLPPVTGG